MIRLRRNMRKERWKKRSRRILVTGCPIGGATEKVIRAIEDNGGIVVTYESCSGAKPLTKLVDEDNPDVYDALARRYRISAVL